MLRYLGLMLGLILGLMLRVETWEGFNTPLCVAGRVIECLEFRVFDRMSIQIQGPLQCKFVITETETQSNIDVDVDNFFLLRYRLFVFICTQPQPQVAHKATTGLRVSRT